MLKLIDAIIADDITMVTRERFLSILRHSDKIKTIPGDIVECGVWRGGMAIFLAKLFANKTLWACDSFEGCQDPSLGRYYYSLETHTLGMYASPLQEVIHNFVKYDITSASFLKGWVRDTLRPDVCPIDKIALLRVDVDSYSATLETLEYLYDKVSSGGMIVFDDASLPESFSAIKDFFYNREIPTLYNPHNDEVVYLADKPLPCGTYMFKKERENL